MLSPNAVKQLVVKVLLVTGIIVFFVVVTYVLIGAIVLQVHPSDYWRQFEKETTTSGVLQR